MLHLQNDLNICSGVIKHTIYYSGNYFGNVVSLTLYKISNLAKIIVPPRIKWYFNKYVVFWSRLNNQEYLKFQFNHQLNFSRLLFLCRYVKILTIPFIHLFNLSWTYIPHEWSLCTHRKVIFILYIFFNVFIARSRVLLLVQPFISNKFIRYPGKKVLQIHENRKIVHACYTEWKRKGWYDEKRKKRPCICFSL